MSEVLRERRARLRRAVRHIGCAAAEFRRLQHVIIFRRSGTGFDEPANEEEHEQAAVLYRVRR
ncbi:MAG TPA: hypothetical protein VIQ62_12480, partial [Burkholderiales bacterium]